MLVRKAVILLLAWGVPVAACARDASDPASSATPTMPPPSAAPAAGPSSTQAPPALGGPPPVVLGPELVETGVPTTQAAVSPLAFDYESAAVHASTSSTAVGTIEWYKTSVVPSEWLYSGFPTPSFVADPFAYDRSWARVAAGADCCQTITRTDDGWVGIGPATAGDRCRLAVWESPNGTEWIEAGGDPFGPEGPCSASRLVEHGRSAAFFGTGPSGSTVWVSHGLETWNAVDIDFTKEGTDTFVTSAIAGPAGFAIFAVRVAHEPTARSETGIRLGPYPFEWLAWLSPDGVEWHKANMANMFGTPWCTPNHPAPCGHIDAMMTDDGIVAYLHQAADSTVPDMRDGWALWIGLIE